MAALKASLALLLCLLQLPAMSTALFKYKKMGYTKRYGGASRNRVAKRAGDIFFKGEDFSDTTLGTRHSSLVLECAVGGPTPTVHWLKDGVRMQQGDTHNVRDDEASFENHRFSHEGKLRLATTNSKLYLDCLNDSDNAVYTCVAETPYRRITRSTKVKVVKPDFDVFSEMEGCIGKKSGKGEPAKIYMWTSTRLEYEGRRVQLYCRAQGYPTPTITWYDVTNKPITDGVDNYKIARNGDLIISSVSFMQNMGTFTCEADNGFGTDSQRAFLYPTLQGFP